ncbi:hypothetical protein BS47DRAFT_1368716 [Hydnum rufescens UP504]|uniref:Uncharacterized protein n=1 Tax=Hydnum rufescens UP504 TaxID=1448309 RepID=A0A9P6DNE4_9AGAM|nr:hypothetical protein BS47DRAFT_1368716 [Hydnum rufescens UP504]
MYLWGSKVLLISQSPPPPSFSSPHLTTQTALDNTHNMDPDHVDDNEGMHLGGWFSAEQVAWAQNRCIEFLADLDAKAKEWKRSPESSSYRQSNPNLDSSVSASEYTSNVVRPAYLKLNESFGAAAAKQIAQSGGDIAWIMSAQKEKWTHDMQWLATMDVHAMFIMHEALCEFMAEESQKKRAFDLSNVYKTRTAIKGMLAAYSGHTWNFRNFLPNAQFPNFSSEYSDHYGTSHWKALYFALQDTNPERKVTLSSLDDWPEGDALDIPLIVDHNGDMILLLKGARDAASKKVAGGSSGGGANLVDGGVTKKIRELSSDLRKGTKRAKGKQKLTLLSSAYINSKSDNAVESDPSGPSKTSTLQHSDYPGTAQPDDLFGFSMGHQQGHAEIGMHDFGGPSTMSDGLNYENGVARNSMDVTWGLDSLGLSTSFQQLVHVAGMKFRDWGPLGPTWSGRYGVFGQLGPMSGGLPSGIKQEPSSDRESSTSPRSPDICAPTYHDPHKSAPSALGATKEAMRPSSDLFAMKMEMTPAVMPDVWYGLVVEIFHTQEELMDTVALAEAQGADGWKQHKVTKNGLSLGLIFKSLVCRDNLFRTLKQDDRFSNVTLLNFTQIHTWLPYQMWKDPGYLQHLWAPPSRHCPPSTPHTDFAQEKERSRQELLLVELLEAEKYPPIIHSSGPDPLSMLIHTSDYNLSFTKSVYASESGPYVKLLRFIASKVETAVKLQSTQCDLVSEAQQGKLNVLQLSETIGYKGEGRK